MNRPAVLLVALALGLGASLVPREARACSCVPPPPPAVALERASAVFVGEVRATTKASDLKRQVTFHVERAFKGVEGAEVTLTTPTSSAACGRSFEVGQRYLVYAERIEGELYDNLCTRTALVEHAKQDLDALEAVARGDAPPPTPHPAAPEEEAETEDPPPSGAAEPSEQPALEEAPPPSSEKAPGEPQRPADAPAGHCAAVAATASEAGLLALALVGLCLLPRRRRAGGRRVRSRS